MQFSLKQTKTHTKNSEINLNNIFVDVKAKRTTKKTKAAWCASPPPGGVQVLCPLDATWSSGMRHQCTGEKGGGK